MEHLQVHASHTLTHQTGASMLVAVVYWLILSIVQYINPFASRLDERKRVDAHTRIVSLVNVLVCVFGSMHMYSVNAHAFGACERSVFTSDALRDRYLVLLAGYLMYDACVLCVWRKFIWDPLMLLVSPPPPGCVCVCMCVWVWWG